MPSQLYTVPNLQRLFRASGTNFVHRHCQRCTPTGNCKLYKPLACCMCVAPARPCTAQASLEGRSYWDTECLQSAGVHRIECCQKYNTICPVVQFVLPPHGAVQYVLQVLRSTLSRLLAASLAHAATPASPPPLSLLLPPQPVLESSMRALSQESVIVCHARFTQGLLPFSSRAMHATLRRIVEMPQLQRACRTHQCLWCGDL